MINKRTLQLLMGLSIVLLTSCSLLSSSNPMQTYFLHVPMPSTAVIQPQFEHNLLVNLPQIAAGYNRTDMLYSRQPAQLAYYRHSQWLDTPSRMLHPLLVEYLEKQNLFSQVISANQAQLLGQWQLDSEILRLQQNFYTNPAEVEFKIRVQVIDTQRRYVVGGRLFHLHQAVSQNDAFGGVEATNQLMTQFLQQLSEWLRGLA